MSRMTRKAAAALIGVVLATAAAILPAAPASAAAFYPLKNVGTGKCLAIGNSNPDNGARAIQWTCTTNANQLWAMEEYNGQGAAYAIRNLATNKCLTISGEAVVQTTCVYGATKQFWYPRYYSNGIRLMNGGMMAIPSASSANGVGAIVWSDSGNTEQRWVQRH